MKKVPVKVQVSVILQDEDAEQFLKFKEKELLTTNAQAAYKLIVQRLREIKSQDVAA